MEVYLSEPLTFKALRSSFLISESTQLDWSPAKDLNLIVLARFEPMQEGKRRLLVDAAVDRADLLAAL